MTSVLANFVKIIPVWLSPWQPWLLQKASLQTPNSYLCEYAISVYMLCIYNVLYVGRSINLLCVRHCDIVVPSADRSSCV